MVLDTAGLMPAGVPVREFQVVYGFRFPGSKGVPPMKFNVGSIVNAARESRSVAVRLFAVSLAALVIFCLTSTTAFGLCSLTGTVSTWNDGNSTVTLNIAANVNDLQLASGNTLDFNGNTSLTVNGSQILNAGLINVNG